MPEPTVSKAQPITREALVAALDAAALAKPEELAQFPPEQTAHELAEALVQAKKLTKFQATQLLAGRGAQLVWGEYVLQDKIGQGGMGQVFKAVHRRMKRTVALKVLSPVAMKNPDAVKRFQREVEAAASLTHPNIVNAYDAGVVRGNHFLVMEFVDGRDLASLLQQSGPVSVELALDCLLQAARGLAFAHSKGVIHRDIKPGNLLIDREGTVKILDMGLARIEFGEKEELTTSGQVMGTVDYMAPEQAFDTRTADARSDIYSLGCTLYRLLTGERIYAGDTILQTMLAHREAPIPSLVGQASRLSQSPEVLAKVDTLFHRLVAKQPPDRPQTMNDVICELESLRKSLDGESVHDGPEDSHLAHFLAGLSGKHSGSKRGSSVNKTAISSTRGARQPTLQSAVPRTTTGHEPTIDLQAPPQETTDSKLTSLARPVPPVASLTAGAKVRRQQRLLVGGALVLVLSGIVAGLVIYSQIPQSGQAVPVGRASSGNPNSPAKSDRDGRTTLPPLAKAPFDAAQAHIHQDAWAAYLGVNPKETNSVGMTLMLIPPGEFMMGSTDEQVEAALKVAEETKADVNTIARIREGERPQHRVVITQPFLMSATEVTIGQYKKFAAASGYQTEAEQALKAAKAAPPDPAAKPIITYLNPGYAVTDEMPASVITWNDAVAFCVWLSEQEKLPRPYDGTVGKWTVPTGKGYHLPTEAQWEYACRAGTTTQYSFGDDHQRLKDYAWYGGGGARDVGLKPPNNFGLHDMHGNVYEWCQDWYDKAWYSTSPAENPIGPFSGSNRVIRGGYWNYYYVSNSRCAYRNNNAPSARYSTSHGFRPVRGW